MKNLCLTLTLLFYCTTSIAADEKPAPLRLSSPAFKHQGTIPTQYTCDGQNLPPPLQISGVPKKAQSLMLIMADQDGSTQTDTAIHWFLYNIPPTTKAIPGNPPASMPTGRNSNGYYAYLGPCPKEGTHHYYFALYALDMVLPETISSIQEASGLMQGHLIGFANMMGAYTKV